MGRPFCSCGNSNINVLPTLIISRCTDNKISLRQFSVYSKCVLQYHHHFFTIPKKTTRNCKIELSNSMLNGQSGPVLHQRKAIHMHSIAILAEKILPVATKGKRTSHDTETAQHQHNIKSVQSTTPVTQFSQAAISLKNRMRVQLLEQSIINFSYSLYMQTTRAEAKLVNALVQHNIPLAFADQLSPLMKEIFPDSEIARNFALATTKTTCMTNGSLASSIFQGSSG